MNAAHKHAVPTLLLQQDRLKHGLGPHSSRAPPLLGSARGAENALSIPGRLGRQIRAGRTAGRVAITPGYQHRRVSKVVFERSLAAELELSAASARSSCRSG